MRRKGPPRRSKFLHTRITPAYAGKSLAGLHDTPHVWDHPRLCGEKLIAISIFLCASGSPPPMRGKDEFDMDEVDDARITPAYAGKRACGGRDEKRRKDHPRLCGEKRSRRVLVDAAEGSPPPMRGKANGTASFSDGYRITPAYAGKSIFVDCSTIA